MVVGEAAAVGVDSKLSTGCYPAALHKGTSLALLAEPEVFEEQDRVDGERVVEHSHVHVLVFYARHRVSLSSGVGGSRRSKVRHLGDVAVPVGFARAEQVYGGLSQIFCALR